MRSVSISMSLAMLLFAMLFAQENYEPGVILLQVQQPSIVSIENGQLINGNSQLLEIFQQYGVTGSRKLSHVNEATDGWYRIEVSIESDLEIIRSALSVCPDVRQVTLNYYGILAGTPNDSLWSDQWALQLIQMAQAWDVALPDNTILVGVMDSGINYAHVDLSDNIWINKGYDFVDDDDDPQDEPGAPVYHGTRVAGVIGARTYNTTGLAGIAGGWQSQTGIRLIALRIVDEDYGYWNEDRAFEAINYLTNLRQQGHTVIANMSIGTTGVGDEPMPDFADAISSAKDAGVIMVAAAGNTVSNPHSPYQQPGVFRLPIPARYDGVLAIGASQYGATLEDEERSLYSLYDDLARLLVVAPVDKPEWDVVTTYSGNSYVDWFHGTSAAAPMAVGVIALMLSANPYLGRTHIEDGLKSTAEKIGPYTYLNGRAEEVGYGRINAQAAVQYAADLCNDPPPTPANFNLTHYRMGNTWRPKLTWAPVDYPCLAGYKLERKINSGSWETIRTFDPATTSFLDVQPVIKDSWNLQTVYYRLRAYDIDDRYSDYTPIRSTNFRYFLGKELPDVAENGHIPQTFFLHANHPNPFNPATTLRYDLPEASRLTLAIYDIMGREVRSWNLQEPAGYRQMLWYGKDQSGRSVPAGIYIYRLTAASIESDEHFMASRKMVLIR